MKIYTKTGDDGRTGLLGPGRVAKDDPRIEAYGTVDELNAALGVVATEPGLDDAVQGWLGRIQDDLFVVGSALADPDPQGRFHNALAADRIERLESGIDGFDTELKPLTQFILPGGSPGAARLHLARTVCRRAERRVVELSQSAGQHVPEPLVIYLNRLSDFLFVLARVVNHRAGVAEATWGGL